MPKQKIEEAMSLSKYERQNFQRLYTQSAAAYVSVRNLAKTSRLPVSKMRQFFTVKGFLYKIYFDNKEIHENEGFC